MCWYAIKKLLTHWPLCYKNCMVLQWSSINSPASCYFIYAAYTKKEPCRVSVIFSSFTHNHQHSYPTAIKQWQKIQWKTCHQMASLAFIYFKVQFQPGLCPGRRWRSLRCSPKPPSRLRRGISSPPPYSMPLVCRSRYQAWLTHHFSDASAAYNSLHLSMF